MGESLSSHSLHSFAEFLKSHINSPEASSCLTSRWKPLQVLKPFRLSFMATEKSAKRVAESAVGTLPRICLQICTSCTRQTQRKPMENTGIKFNGFEDIGQRYGSSTDLSLLSMPRRMPSSDPGEIYYTKIFLPGPRLKLLSKASIRACFTDHNQRTLTLHL